jgi:hypothetical protein
MQMPYVLRLCTLHANMPCCCGPAARCDQGGPPYQVLHYGCSASLPLSSAAAACIGS